MNAVAKNNPGWVRRVFLSWQFAFVIGMVPVAALVVLINDEKGNRMFDWIEGQFAAIKVGFGDE